jgi:uncharacterized membrane protein YheB (UPF0754 family)
MKIFPFLLAIICIPSVSFAEDIDNQIDKACLRHAVSLISKLKSKVIGDLNQKKSDQALKLATDSCQAYFKKEFHQNPESVTSVSSNDKIETENDNMKDWFTEKILSGDVKRKKGNKRLKKLKH